MSIFIATLGKAWARRRSEYPFGLLNVVRGYGRVIQIGGADIRVYALRTTIRSCKRHAQIESESVPGTGDRSCYSAQETLTVLHAAGGTVRQERPWLTGIIGGQVHA